MVARRIEEAVDAFLVRTRRTTACVTSQPVIALRSPVASHVYEAAFAPRSAPARIQEDATRRTILFQIRLSFEVTHASDLRQGNGTRAVSYEYRILDRDEREVLAFHWHPSGLSDVTDPHLHLSSQLNPVAMGRGQESLLLADMHIPTGFVTIEDVVRLLIAEFGVRPRSTEWDTILRENRSLALAGQAD